VNIYIYIITLEFLILWYWKRYPFFFFGLKNQIKLIKQERKKESKEPNQERKKETNKPSKQANMFFTRIVPRRVFSPLTTTTTTRPFSASSARRKTAVETVRDAAKVVDRAVAGKLVDGIEASRKYSILFYSILFLFSSFLLFFCMWIPFLLREGEWGKGVVGGVILQGEIYWLTDWLTPTETVAQKAKEVAGMSAGEAKGSASEVAGEAKGKASEVVGAVKGKANEAMGEAKGKANEVKGKMWGAALAWLLAARYLALDGRRRIGSSSPRTQWQGNSAVLHTILYYTVPDISWIHWSSPCTGGAGQWWEISVPYHGITPTVRITTHLGRSHTLAHAAKQYNAPHLNKCNTKRIIPKGPCWWDMKVGQ